MNKNNFRANRNLTAQGENLERKNERTAFNSWRRLWFFHLCFPYSLFPFQSDRRRRTETGTGRSDSIRITSSSSSYNPHPRRYLPPDSPQFGFQPHQLRFRVIHTCMFASPILFLLPIRVPLVLYHTTLCILGFSLLYIQLLCGYFPSVCFLNQPSGLTLAFFSCSYFGSILCMFISEDGSSNTISWCLLCRPCWC